MEKCLRLIRPPTNSLTNVYLLCLSHVFPMEAAARWPTPATAFPIRFFFCFRRLRMDSPWNQDLQTIGCMHSFSYIFVSSEKWILIISFGKLLEIWVDYSWLFAVVGAAECWVWLNSSMWLCCACWCDITSSASPCCGHALFMSVLR